ncbi:MAG TPA: hypothetical protein VGW35_07225 [Methylomirabilota bacterium]|jgi:hypothetical protein|nr:hypothetical protein [Methylomirabilota bacterium]
MISQGEWEPIVIGACRVCGWKALTQGGLCVDCREVREWSRINRAFCRFVHRARYDESESDSDHPLASAA